MPSCWWSREAKVTAPAPSRCGIPSGPSTPHAGHIGPLLEVLGWLHHRNLLSERHAPIGERWQLSCRQTSECLQVAAHIHKRYLHCRSCCHAYPYREISCHTCVSIWTTTVSPNFTACPSPSPRPTEHAAGGRRALTLVAGRWCIWKIPVIKTSSVIK